MVTLEFSSVFTLLFFEYYLYFSFWGGVTSMFTYGGPLLGVYFHIPFWGVHFMFTSGRGPLPCSLLGGPLLCSLLGGPLPCSPSRGVHFHVHFWGGPLSCSPCDLSHTALIYHYRMPSASWAKFTCSSGSRISHRGVLTLWGVPTPKAATFQKFVCQNERIWTRRGACTGSTPGSPLTWEPPEFNRLTDKHE